MEFIAAVGVLYAGLASLAAAAEIAATDFDTATVAYPVVITPTRLKQSLQDVPASVTVITSETLQRFAIQSVPEALRLVPGMAVTEATAGMYQINYHGTNARNSRRMNVLIDGVSIYKPGLSEINWAQLPLTIDDIDRIEVTRGPNSATYGPNSMLAIVNIITRHPKDVGALSASVRAGSRETYGAWVRAGTSFGATTAHLALGADTRDGYDTVNGTTPGHNRVASARLLFRSSTRLDDASSLALQASYLNGKQEVPFKSAYEAHPDKVVDDLYAGATYRNALNANHELQLRLTHSSHRTRQRWVTCFPQVVYLPQMFAMYEANPAYANTILAGQIPSGGTPADDVLAYQAMAAIAALGTSAMQPLCGYGNASVEESRTDLELQDTFVASDALRFVGGIGARYQTADSQTYLGGRASNTLLRAFGNAEYRPISEASMNIGAYVEHDQLVGTTLAPRVALNWQLPANQTLRFVVSKGVRTPDVAEQKGHFTYTLDAFEPGPDGSMSPRFYQSSRSPGGLESEQVVSKEVGYLVRVPKLGLIFDAKLFDDRLTHLISETIDVVGFTPTNDNSVHLSGLELQASYTLPRGLSGFASYAYLANYDATDIIERSQYSRHSGSLGLTSEFPDGWRGSVAYYGSSGDGEGGKAYGRSDLVVAKDISVGEGRCQALVRVSRLDSNSVSYFLRQGRPVPGSSAYHDRWHVAAEVKASF